MPGPIEHVVVLMLENRSFDHLFAYSGLPGLQAVDTTKTNPGARGTVPMSPAAPDVLGTDPAHEFEDADWQLYRAPRGNPVAARPLTLQGFVDRSGPEAMLCAAPGAVPVLTALARNFVLCDQWFASMPGPTWPNRFFVHAGSAGGLANSPSSLTTIGSMIASKLGFSFQNGTIFDAIDRAQAAGRPVTWRVYHGDHFPQVCAIDTMSSVFVADANKFRAFPDFAADVQNGDVASYTFIEPNYSILSNFRNGNSQHPTGALSAGEQLIKDVYDALSSSPAIWQSSLLIVAYDEHGGLYDQAPLPNGCTPPGDAPLNVNKAKSPPNPPFAFDTYGVRVPGIVVSPWVQPGTVSHTVFDHASIVRTVFDLLGLPGSLTARDRGAHSLAALLQRNLQIHVPPALPVAGVAVAAAARAGPTPPNSSQVDAFTRVAAQIHHALTLRTRTPSLMTTALQEAVRTTTDIRTLIDVPKTAAPEESLAYLEKVAGLIDAQRREQGRTALR